MKYDLEKQQDGTVIANITLTSEEWNESINNAYEKNKSKYNVQGFGKGHAPKSVIEKTNVPSFDNCWFKNSDDINGSCNNKELRYKDEEALNMLKQGVCPRIIRKSKTSKSGLVFAGTKSAKKVENFSKQYRFVKIGNDPYQNNVVAEGFTNKGIYINAKNGNISRTYNNNYSCD